AERKQLALLHLFQGFVNVDALMMMGDPEFDWCLPEVRGLTREVADSLLDRAAEIGLLRAHGRGYHSIHPALPWYFPVLFEQDYPIERMEADKSNATNAKRAFVEAICTLGIVYSRRYEIEEHPVVVSMLRAEEHNLLHARELARRHGWWGCVV